MNDLGGSILSAAVLLFFLMDPIGNIPVLLSVLKGIAPKRQRFIIIRELSIALVILIVFLFAGQNLLTFLHLQQESVTISGGIVLLIIGLRLIFPREEGVMGIQADGEPFIVPIAIPMIAGPSVLAMLILMTKNEPQHTINWLYALLLAWSSSALILLSAPFIFKILKERGLKAIERLMGMILVMMAVQMLINGVKILFLTKP
ncbi:YhgN family NAAT transporter [Flavobacterium algicola]|uniref:YhgN family NAAT transporter n=1 Tax=Flavobacterium algicola TaxID=556529 RepID=UPI001EFC5418|nr:YhgN family NAAT transporter [Flavobacterium algicola]MCG9791547.1 YhgN family NAAT transporter [Flavobacterium algicola]